MGALKILFFFTKENGNVFYNDEEQTSFIMMLNNLG